MEKFQAKQDDQLHRTHTWMNLLNTAFEAPQLWGKVCQKWDLKWPSGTSRLPNVGFVGAHGSRDSCQGTNAFLGLNHLWHWLQSMPDRDEKLSLRRPNCRDTHTLSKWPFSLSSLSMSPLVGLEETALPVAVWPVTCFKSSLLNDLKGTCGFRSTLLTLWRFFFKCEDYRWAIIHYF